MKKILQSIMLMAAMFAMLPWVQAQTVLPYTQNFDGASSISDLSGWSVYYSRDASWLLHDGDFQSSISAHSGTQNLFLFSATRGAESDIETPWFRCTNASDNFVRVSFWYSNNTWGNDVDSLRVVLYTGSTASKVLFRTGGTAHGWTQATIDVDISDLNGISFQLLFLGYANYGKGICIDDLSVSSYSFSAYAYPTAGGSVSVGSGSGTSFTLTATPASGYHFAYWSDDNSITTNPRTITSTGGVQSYAAVFSPNDNITDTNRTTTTVNPSITITASPHNSSYGKVAGGGTYRANETARLLAIPNEGYHFRRWSDGSTDNPHTVTVKGAKTYYAYFTEECNGSATSGTDTKTACDSYTWINGTTYTASTTTPTCTLTNRANCDSVVRLNLTIRYGTHYTNSTTDCDYFTWHGTEYRTSGTKTYHYTNSYGCASTETLNLTIVNSTHTSTTATACDSYTWHGRTYTNSGTIGLAYIDLDNYNCYSSDTLHLTIKKSTSENYTKTARSSYTWHGTTYTSSGTYTESYINGDGCPSTVTLNLTIVPIGSLNGLFSVSATKQVYFSQGNLQWTSTGTHAVNGGGTAAGTWRFAEHQYDNVGSANSNASSSYNGWIDLFGWGTSGYHNSSDTYNTNYYPYSTSSTYSSSNTYNNYGYGPSSNMADPNLTGTSANYDWGVYNAISNGGNAPNQWRTLTGEEWNYLCYGRTDHGSKYGTGRIQLANGSYVYGCFLLPDNWTLPAGCSFTAGTTHSLTDYTLNTYTLSQWSQMEAAGAMFLPVTGYRAGTYFNDGDLGYYWSSSFTSGRLARGLRFGGGYVDDLDDPYRGYGRAVRLVHEVN